MIFTNYLVQIIYKKIKNNNLLIVRSVVCDENWIRDKLRKMNCRRYELMPKAVLGFQVGKK